MKFLFLGFKKPTKWGEGRCPPEHKPDRRPGQRYCRSCHAAWMREKRPTYPDLSKEAKRKSACRRESNHEQKRGALVPEPCQRCGAQKAEKHHPDYGNPRLVEWLCRACHLEHHKRERAQDLSRE